MLNCQEGHCRCSKKMTFEPQLTDVKEAFIVIPSKT